MFLAIYLEFATFGERNFGGIAVGKAASEITYIHGPRNNRALVAKKLLQIFKIYSSGEGADVPLYL